MDPRKVFNAVRPAVAALTLISDDFWNQMDAEDLLLELTKDGFSVTSAVGCIRIYDCGHTVFSEVVDYGRHASYSGMMSNQRVARYIFNEVVDRLLAA